MEGGRIEVGRVIDAIVTCNATLADIGLEALVAGWDEDGSVVVKISRAARARSEDPSVAAGANQCADQ